MKTFMIVVGAIVTLVAGLIVVYMVFRMASAGWHRSKAEAKSQLENRNGTT